MDEFKITLKEKVTIIANEAKNFIVKVEKDRKITDKDTGAILETSLYKEQTTFVPDCCFLFEVIDSSSPSGCALLKKRLFNIKSFFLSPNAD